MFQPQHYAKDIAIELANGLMDGTIVLEREGPAQCRSKKQSARAVQLLARREVLEFAGFLTALASLVAVVVKRLPIWADGRKEQQFLSKINDLIQGLITKQSVGPERVELMRLEEKLARTNTSSPQYWPTVFRIINLKTQPIIDISQLRGPAIHLSLSKLPSHLIFEGQSVILSDSGSLDNCRFINCFVSFSDLREPVTFYDVRFIRCAFFIPLTAARSRPAQKVAEALIASRDTKDLSISIAG